MFHLFTSLVRLVIHTMLFAESPQKGTKTKKVDYDFTGEQLHFESPPHRGDLATNIALGATLLWLPLTFAAVGRAAFVKYRFTDKRFSVITDAPWKSMLITPNTKLMCMSMFSGTSFEFN